MPKYKKIIYNATQFDGVIIYNLSFGCRFYLAKYLFSYFFFLPRQSRLLRSYKNSDCNIEGHTCTLARVFDGPSLVLALFCFPGCFLDNLLDFRLMPRLSFAHLYLTSGIRHKDFLHDFYQNWTLDSIFPYNVCEMQLQLALQIICREYKSCFKGSSNGIS